MLALDRNFAQVAPSLVPPIAEAVVFDQFAVGATASAAALPVGQAAALVAALVVALPVVALPVVLVAASAVALPAVQAAALAIPKAVEVVTAEVAVELEVQAFFPHQLQQPAQRTFV